MFYQYKERNVAWIYVTTASFLGNFYNSFI